jgi:uncharacterized membrane protein HdeD (DUF308 family)
VGSALAIEQAQASALSFGAAWTLCGGIALYMGTLSLIRATLRRSAFHPVRIISVAATGLVILFAFFHNRLHPSTLLELLAGTLIALLVLKLMWFGIPLPVLGEQPSDIERSGRPDQLHDQA